MKKINKILCGILGASFLLAGCATVGNIQNDQTEVIYNGNSAVMVSDNLYFGNSIADIGSGFSYKDAKTYAYLSRLNTKLDFGAKDQDYSPKTVEMVEGEVVGHENSFMFALGDYVYYAVPNQKEFKNDEGKPEKHYDYTTIMRCKLNGDKNKELYTAEGTVSQIEVLKYRENYYIVFLAGTNLIKIEIGNSRRVANNAVVLADNVTSVAIPKTYQKDQNGSSLDWNGYIYYTVDKKDEDNADVKGTVVKKIKADSSKSEDMRATADTYKFVGRQKDVVFYTQSQKDGSTYTYVTDMTNATYNDTILSGKELYRSSVSDFEEIVEFVSDSYVTVGYAFLNSSNLVVAKKTTDGYKISTVDFKSNGSSISSYKIVETSGKTVYLSTTTAIYRADLSAVLNDETNEVDCTTLTKMTAISDKGLTAFDGKYIYFYAKLETVETSNDDSEEKVEETDDNYYMYRTSVGKVASDEQKNYELLSLTKINSRRSK